VVMGSNCEVREQMCASDGWQKWNRCLAIGDFLGRLDRLFLRALKWWVLWCLFYIFAMHESASGGSHNVHSTFLLCMKGRSWRV
jgi:hypothetical protein